MLSVISIFRTLKNTRNTKYFYLILFVICSFVSFRAGAITNYVSLTGNHIQPFTNWYCAATNINLAVSAAVTGSTIIVDEGIYKLHETLEINDITLLGLHGAERTIIDGDFPNVSNVCVETRSGNVLIKGFTIKNGYGYGLHSFLMVNLLLDQCIFENNFGDGMNLASSFSPVQVRNCLIVHNKRHGIKMTSGEFTGNENYYVINCTIVSNQSYGVHITTYPDPWGDRPFRAELRNTIIYYNKAGNWRSGHYTDASFTSCCTTPAKGGNYITNAPFFVDMDNDNYRLQTNSPCINMGQNESWMYSSFDMENKIRIYKDNVDIGAYEFAAPYSIVNFYADNPNGVPPHTVYFNSNVHAANKDNIYYQWDFENDGVFDIQGVNSNEIEYTYTTIGTYSVLLAVSNSVNGTAELLLTNYIHVVTNIFADFFATPVTGSAPLVVEFTDTSENAFQSWKWDLNNDGITDSSTQYPTFYYENTGTFTITLSVSNYFGSSNVLYNSIVKTNYIHITNYQAIADFTVKKTNVIIGESVHFTNLSRNNPSSYSWNFGPDGVGDTSAMNPVVIYYKPGLKTVSLKCSKWEFYPLFYFSETVEKADYINVTSPYGETPIHYVSKAGNNIVPFHNWKSAATNISEAIKAADIHDTIIVDDGVYSSISCSIPLTIKSINGADNTIIDGNGSQRCVYLGAPCEVNGFTLRNGYNSQAGGGVFCSGVSTVRNCRITNNEISDIYPQGAGVNGGTYFNCIISSNICWGAEYHGSSARGGGAYGATLYNCIVSDNEVYRGGGDGRGGGTCGGNVYNSIVLKNRPDNYVGGIIRWTCTAPLPTGTGNISVDPLFEEGSYHISSNSPCIDAGTNMDWMWTAFDFDGDPRINGTTVDMGAYEYIPESTGFVVFLFLICCFKQIFACDSEEKSSTLTNRERA